MARFVRIKASPVNLHASHPQAAQRFENSPPFLRARKRQRRENSLLGRFGGMLTRQRAESLAGTDFEQHVSRIFQQLGNAVGEANGLAEMSGPVFDRLRLVGRDPFAVTFETKGIRGSENCTWRKSSAKGASADSIIGE